MALKTKVCKNACIVSMNPALVKVRARLHMREPSQVCLDFSPSSIPRV